MKSLSVSGFSSFIIIIIVVVFLLVSFLFYFIFLGALQKARWVRVSSFVVEFAFIFFFLRDIQFSDFLFFFYISSLPFFFFYRVLCCVTFSSFLFFPLSFITYIHVYIYTLEPVEKRRTCVHVTFLVLDHVLQ